jgi:hypothetical protein
MKKALLLPLLTLLLQVALAQDVILKLDGEEIPARVLEITLEAIRYQHPADSLQADTLHVPRTEVFMIRFANGTKEVFSENLPENQVPEEQPLRPDQMYLKGQHEALRYYKGSGAMWGAAASSLFWPYGLAGAIVIGGVPPRINPVNVSDIRLLRDANFVRGYEKQAHRRKMGRAAIGAGIGTATAFGALLVILAATFN